MSDFRADLHCHTTCSDGTLTPREIIQLAKEIGLKGLAITDHDSVQGYLQAVEHAKNEGILLGPGAEFSSDFAGHSVHILGYDFDPLSAEISKLCAGHQERRRERNLTILSKLSKLGMEVSFDELSQLGESSIGRPHIAYLLMKKGFIGSIQEGFDRFLGDGKPAYDPGEPFSTKATIEIIHQAGGKAFLAHPHLINNSTLVKNLLALDLDGLECYYSRFSREKERRWLNMAEKKHLLISGGSDFHGGVKPYIPLGCSWVNEEHFYKVFSKTFS